MKPLNWWFQCFFKQKCSFSHMAMAFFLSPPRPQEMFSTKASTAFGEYHSSSLPPALWFWHCTQGRPPLPASQVLIKFSMLATVPDILTFSNCVLWKTHSNLWSLWNKLFNLGYFPHLGCIPNIILPWKQCFSYTRPCIPPCLSLRCLRGSPGSSFLININLHITYPMVSTLQNCLIVNGIYNSICYAVLILVSNALEFSQPLKTCAKATAF